MGGGVNGFSLRTPDFVVPKESWLGPFCLDFDVPADMIMGGLGAFSGGSKACPDLAFDLRLDRGMTWSPVAGGSGRPRTDVIVFEVMMMGSRIWLMAALRKMSPSLLAKILTNTNPLRKNEANQMGRRRCRGC